MKITGWISRLNERLLHNELIRRVVRNSAYLFSATGVSAGMSMVQGILAARLLGVYGFGVLGTVTVFTSVVNKLASFRMNELVVKYVGHYHERGDKKRAAAVFKAASLIEIFTSAAAYGLLLVLAPLGARYFIKDMDALPWIQIYGLIVLANLMAESATGLLQIFDRFRRIAVINVIQSAVTLVLIGAAFMYYSAVGGSENATLAVILAYMSGKIFGAVTLTVTALAHANRLWGAGWWKTPLSLLRENRRELVSFGLNTNLSATINLVNKDAELLWVTFFRNPLEAGYYKLALALANMVQLPIAPLPHATYPELSREVSRKNWNNVRYILRQGSLMAGSYTLVTSVGLLVLGPWLIPFIYGAEFQPAYPALLILLVGFFAANTFYWNRASLLALGHPEYPTRVNLIAALIKIGLTLVLVPRYGFYGSAALLSGFYLFSILLNVLKTWQVLNRLPEDGMEKAAAG